MSDTGLVEDLPFHTAAEFLDALGRRQARWQPDPTNWIFRGHADARWVLLPSALRHDVRLEYGPGYREGRVGPRATHGEQVRTEAELAIGFVQRANVQGLGLPAAFEEILRDPGRYQHMVESEATGAYWWPREELLPLLALGQHYGVPTRLLDWTESPLVAAYFAAEKAARWAAGEGRPDAVTELAVVALNEARLAELGFRDKGPNHVNVVRVAGASVPALQAQRGVFTVVERWHQRDNTPLDVTPLDVELAERVRRRHQGEGPPTNSHGGAAALFYRLRLPITEAPTLLRYAAEEGVAGHTLFPGYAGAARGLEEMRYWDIS